MPYLPTAIEEQKSTADHSEEDVLCSWSQFVDKVTVEGGDGVPQNDGDQQTKTVLAHIHGIAELLYQAHFTLKSVAK